MMTQHNSGPRHGQYLSHCKFLPSVYTTYLALQIQCLIQPFVQPCEDNKAWLSKNLFIQPTLGHILPRQGRQDIKQNMPQCI